MGYRLRPYFLQPYASPRSIGPNYYNVSYRRNMAYKGMGQDGVENVPASSVVSGPLLAAYTLSAAAGGSDMAPPGPAPPVLPIPSTAGGWVWIIAGGVGLIFLMEIMTRP